MTTSAFGVDLSVEDVEKSFKEGYRKAHDEKKSDRAHDKEMRSKLSRKERVGAELGGGLYSAGKAPKGRRGEAFKEHVNYIGGGNKVFRKVGRTNSGAHAHVKEKMSKSAFGVDFTAADVVSKADPKKPSGGRYATAYVAPGLHGALAARKGKKLKAAGSELGHSLAGGYGGAALGAGLGAAAGAVTHNAKAGSKVGYLAGSLSGGVIGSRAGTQSNQAKGRYKN